MCFDGSTNVNILSELINISLLGVKSEIHLDTLPFIITHGFINLQSGWQFLLELHQSQISESFDSLRVILG